MKEYKDMTNRELMREYNYLRNRIDGVIEGGYGKYELYDLEEIMHEMAKREE